MSVPPELIQKMMGGGAAPGAAGGATPPGAAPGGPGSASAMPVQAPAAAPMSKPQNKAGLQAAARVNIHIAQTMLEEALGSFGSETPEGMAVMDCLKKLAKLGSKKDSSDLVPAEMLQMFRQMPQMGGGTDIQKLIQQQMQKPPGAAGAAPAPPTMQ